MKKKLCIFMVMATFVVGCDKDDDRPDPATPKAFQTKVATGNKVHYEGLNFQVPIGFKGEEERFDDEYEISKDKEGIMSIEKSPKHLPVDVKWVNDNFYYVENDGDAVGYYKKSSGEIYEVEYDGDEGNYVAQFEEVLSSIIELN